MRPHFLGLLVTAAVLLSGCTLDTARLYDGSIPEPPQRWPDDAAACAGVTDIIKSLGIAVTWTKFPLLPNGIAGCGWDHHVALMDDSVGAGYNGIDSTGRGIKSYNAYYEIKLESNHHLCLDKQADRNSSACVSLSQYFDPTWMYHPPNIPSWGPGPKGPDRVSKIWTFNHPLFDRTETINGLVWRHYMFWRYESLSSDPAAPPLPVDSPQGKADETSALAPVPVVSVPYPNALEMVGEVYEHAVDADHTMLVFANYMRPVTQDAQWFAARRTMLRKLVDAVTIRPLTPGLWHTLMLQYGAQVTANGESRSQAEMRAEAERTLEVHQKAEGATGH